MNKNSINRNTLWSAVYCNLSITCIKKRRKATAIGNAQAVERCTKQLVFWKNYLTDKLEF